MTATPTSQDGQFVSLVRHRTKTDERSDCVRAEGDSKETRLDSFLPVSVVSLPVPDVLTACSVAVGIVQFRLFICAPRDDLGVFGSHQFSTHGFPRR